MNFNQFYIDTIYTTSDSTPLSRTRTVGLKLVLLTTASTFAFFLELLAGCLLRLRVGLCKTYIALMVDDVGIKMMKIP